MNIAKGKALMQQIIQKSWEDKAFKQELIANTIHTIEELTGKRINLPEGKILVVNDQTDQSIVYLNIPAKFNLDDYELNEEQLEAVAGGTTDPDDEHNGFTWNDFVAWITGKQQL